MNIALWILQVLLALHTVMGAVWKFSNTAPSVGLGVLPHGAWLALSVLELVAAVALVLPAKSRRLALAAPAGALFVAAEMLLFCGATAASGKANAGELGYWGVVAVLAALIARGRWSRRPV